MEIYFNANVITMDQGNPSAEAFAVCDGKFFSVDSNETLKNVSGKNVRFIDLGGRTVIPGFIESHCQPSEYATHFLQVECAPAAAGTIDDVKRNIRQRASSSPAGQWIRGFGFDDTLIGDRRHLTRKDLDEASPDNPVYITHVTSHIAYVNSLALSIAGIGPDTPQPSGGEIKKDKSGYPTGVLVEPSAMNQVSRLIPHYSVEERKKAFEKTFAYFHTNGITSSHDAAIGYFRDTPHILRTYSELERENRLSLRIYMTILEEYYAKLYDTGLGTCFGSVFLKLGGVKFFQDGSIQTLSAALSRGYENKPEWNGHLTWPQDELNRLVEKYHSAGLQVAIHCNGDAAIESVLQAFESAQAKYPRQRHRHMLIHCQMASEDQIRRMKALGAVPSYFINHVYYWGDRHRDIFLGEPRASIINPLGSSVREGLMFALHSDLPVTPVSPLEAMHTAVNRRTSSGLVLGADECISPMEAIKAYTINAAYCSFEENIKGGIEEGKLADFTVLNNNPLTVDPGEIKNIQVQATVVGGRLVFGEF